MTVDTVQTGEVVWYNDRKGYGFVHVETEEIFLHRSALERFGLATIYAGDQIQVTITKNNRGIVIQDIIALERAKSNMVPKNTEPQDNEVVGTVKFFNPAKGYGFVDIGDGKADVFVHLRTLCDCGVHHLNEGQKLLLVVTDDGRGPQAASIRLLAPE